MGESIQSTMGEIMNKSILLPVDVFKIRTAGWVENSVDIEQMLHSVALDLGLTLCSSLSVEILSVNTICFFLFLKENTGIVDNHKTCFSDMIRMSIKLFSQRNQKKLGYFGEIKASCLEYRVC